MRLPVIRKITQFIEDNDQDYVTETIETLEFIVGETPIKDEEIDAIGELLSDLYGSIEVTKMMKEQGLSQKDALNSFMKRVLGSIDK